MDCRVAKRYNWSDDFGSESYYIEEWSDLVIEQIRENEKNNRLSNLIIHPITMYLCDEFKSFEKILNEIQKYEVVNFSDIYNQKRKIKGSVSIFLQSLRDPCNFDVFGTR